MSHPHHPPHQPGMGRHAAGQHVAQPTPPPIAPQVSQAQPPRMPAPPPGPTPSFREQPSDFGDAREFKPGTAAAQLHQAVSRAATDAAQGDPQSQKPAPSKSDPTQPYVFEFSYPIDNGGKEPISKVTFRRPKWSDFQKAMRHRLVMSGEMTDNDALISAVTGINMELIPEIDGFDGARLLVEVQNFFLADPMAKLSGT